MLGSYGSVYALGHKAVADILDGEIEVSEKTDGSQCSFGVLDGDLFIRSRNQPLYVGGNNGMFNLAVEQIVQEQHLLHPGWVYRGEYLQKPKHNTLSYGRVPHFNIMIYDIECGLEEYLLGDERAVEARRIGFEPVPLLFKGSGATVAMLMELLDTDSVLGGGKIEGVVVKNYSQFGSDKKVAKAKLVGADFQEKHPGEWRTANPTRSDIVLSIIETYRVEARWRKAVQHLRDDGTLEGSPRDIGALIREVQTDLLKEEEDAIKDILFSHFKGQIVRGAVKGLAERYKQWLAEGSV